MNCEICGKEIKKANRIIIESTILNVCDDCKKLGKPVEAATAEELPFLPPEIIQQRLKTVNKPARDELDSPEVLVEDFGARIKKARESKKLTIEDLAKKLLEKKTLLSKIERQESKPDDKLIKKIEKELNIKLKEKVDFIKSASAKKEGSMTLGDYIKKKKG